MLKIESTELGAELTSVKLDGQEKLHDGQSYWTGRAPILFPCVGRLKDDKTEINRKVYEMGRHGFARKSEFKKLSENSYVLIPNEEIKKMYPYGFELYMSYESDGNTLINKCKVVNKGKETMYFGLGFHPAFKCDYSSSRYYIEFEKEEDTIEILNFIADSGYIGEGNLSLGKHFKDGKMVLNRDTFADDAIVLANMKSNKVTLRSDEEKILTFHFTGFPYLGVWSKEGAPYVCLEPWYNLADRARIRWSIRTQTQYIKIRARSRI